MAEMLTVLPPKVNDTNSKTAVPPKIMVDYTPEYIREQLDLGGLERIPADDVFCDRNEAMLKANMKMLKVPSPEQVIEGITMVGTIFTVLNDAIKKGRNLYETLVDWLGSNKDMTDEQKVKAMQIGQVLAKEMTPSTKEAA